MIPQRSRPTELQRQLLPLIGIAVLLIALLGSIWWGFGQRDDKDAAEANLEQAQMHMAQQTSQTNAIAYRLNATPNGPERGSGTAFMPLTGSGVLNVVNLEPIAEGQALQLWYFVSDETPPVAGGTFPIDANGSGFLLIPADVGTFGGLGISIEPSAGSISPTTPMILQGSVSTSRG